MSGPVDSAAPAPAGDRSPFDKGGCGRDRRAVNGSVGAGGRGHQRQLGAGKTRGAEVTQRQHAEANDDRDGRSDRSDHAGAPALIAEGVEATDTPRRRDILQTAAPARSNKAGASSGCAATVHGGGRWRGQPHGHWDHVDAPASIARGERGHRSHDRQGQGRRASGITSTRGLRSGGATAAQWRREVADGGGTDRSVVGSTTMRGRPRVAPMGRCRSSGQRLPRGEVSPSDDDRRCLVMSGGAGGYSKIVTFSNSCAVHFYVRSLNVCKHVQKS